MGKKHELRNRGHLTIIGFQEPLKNGFSSGSVVKTEIVRFHWWEKMQGSGGFEPANTRKSTAAALTTFKRIGPGSVLQDPTRDFEIECKVWEGFRNYSTKHDMIMLDWGSITVFNHTGAPISHSSIFELATCSLKDLLKTMNVPSDTTKRISCLHALSR